MNINVYIEDYLAKKIKESAEKMGKTRNAIIRQALKEWLQRHETRQWPSSIKKFNGVKNFSGFESYRDELLPPKEDPWK